MPIDQTQPSKPERPPSGDPLAETDKHIPDTGRTQASRPAKTQQTRTMPPAPGRPNGKQRKMGRAAKVLLTAAAFLGGLVLLVGISGAAGFFTGKNEGDTIATLEMSTYLMTQYQRAADDYAAGNYLLARDRLVYIVEKDREFSAAVDLLIEVQMVLNLTATPPPSTATVTMTPTPDMRPADDQYNTAVLLITQGAWDLALETLSNLRKVHPSFRIVDVDGLMYLALRNRGVEKIRSGELEGGIYDFSLAEKFGPLDNEANNYRGWARLYLLGNAFWGAYPEQAAYYYGQLVGVGVDIRDASGVSAFYRYWASLAQMGDFSAEEGEWCLASEQYQVALNSAAWDSLFPTATHAYNQCAALTPSVTPTPTYTVTIDPLTLTAEASQPPAGGTATFTPTPTSTPTNTTGAPVDTATYTPTPTDTATPTATQTPTDTVEAAP